MLFGNKLQGNSRMPDGIGGAWRKFYKQIGLATRIFGEFGTGGGSDLRRVPDEEAVLAAGSAGDREGELVVRGRPCLGDNAQPFGRGAESG